jgi:hypothetical protein
MVRFCGLRVISRQVKRSQFRTRKGAMLFAEWSAREIFRL